MNEKSVQRLELLLFSVGGVRFGVDAGQIAGVDIYEGEEADDLFWFHNELGYALGEGLEQGVEHGVEGGAASSHYSSPVVATIRSLNREQNRVENNESYRVIIDNMDDIAEFSQSDIRLFPALLEPFLLKRGLWGVLSKNDALVLLIDFQLLLKRK